MLIALVPQQSPQACEITVDLKERARKSLGAPEGLGSNPFKLERISNRSGPNVNAAPTEDG